MVVLLNSGNIAKVDPNPALMLRTRILSNVKKALSSGFSDAKCAVKLPLPGTVFLSDELRFLLLGDYFMESVKSIVRLIDTHRAETKRCLYVQGNTTIPLR